MNNITHFAERKIYLRFLYVKCKCQYAVQFFGSLQFPFGLLDTYLACLFATMRKQHIYVLDDTQIMFNIMCDAMLLFIWIWKLCNIFTYFMENQL